MDILNYDAIVAAQSKTEKDNNEGSVNTSKKMRARNAMQTDKANAEIAVLDAKDAFNVAVVNGNGIAAAALKLKAAEETFSFYTEIYTKLFDSKASV